MILIENAQVFAPKPLGLCSILISDNKIIDVISNAPDLKTKLSGLFPDLQVIDAGGAVTMPGIIDRHVHFNGAGGEGGPRYRTPPLQLSSFINAGVTSAVGLLGTDGTCRGLRDLLMKARGLEDEGISTWILTGSYRIPSVTITGGVLDDICLIDKVIGLKVAASDHRSSHPSTEELRRAVSDARVGGMLAGKAGTVCVHMGSEKAGFVPLMAALDGTDIPVGQFAPTHISRSQELLEASVEFGLRGGNLDITAAPGEKPVFGMPSKRAVKHLLNGGVAAERITLSSDGNGSMPRFDSRGNMTGMGVGPIDSVLACVIEMMDDAEIGPEKAISMATSNVAEQLNLNHKGRIEKNMDADIIVIDRYNKPCHVIAKGQVLMLGGILKAKGTFE